MRCQAIQNRLQVAGIWFSRIAPFGMGVKVVGIGVADGGKGQGGLAAQQVADFCSGGLPVGQSSGVSARKRPFLITLS